MTGASCSQTVATSTRERFAMFTFEDIRNIAVQIEKNGEESYRNAGRMAEDPELARLLSWMADEEKSHGKWFENLGTRASITAEQQEMAALGKSLLQEMIKGNTFLLAQSELEAAETLAAVLSRSQEFEGDTILFYEFLLGLIDDRDTAAQLRKIIDEERNHLQRLSRMAEKAPASGPARPAPADAR